jgi:sugar phosphate isomerase/epimerase
MGLPTLPDRLDESSCVWIAQSFRELGLTMAAISGTFNMCDPTASRIENNLRRLEVLAAACRWLDTRIITLCTGTDDSGDMWKWHRGNSGRLAWERLVETMRAAIKIADRYEVTLAFEPEVHNVVSSVMRARRLLDEIGSPWLKVVIDPANLIHAGDRAVWGESLTEASEWLGPDIVLAHAKQPRFIEEPEKYSAARLGSPLWEACGMALPDSIENLTEKLGIGAGVVDREYALRWSTYYFGYVHSLKRSGFDGALIMHGLEEKEVARASSLLKVILDVAGAVD